MDSDPQTLQQQLQQTELAYQMTVATHQFKSGFLARIAHELRSPLNGLIGMHQLILSDLCDDPQEEREFIAQAHDSALKLLKLIDQILEVARLEYGSRKLDIQPLQLSAVLEQVHNLTQTIAQDRGIRWSFTNADAELYVFADPTYLKQILVSLIETVIRLTAEGEMHLSVQVSPDSQTVQIWIDATYPPSAWSEAIDALYTQEQAQPATQSDRLSPGLLLLMHQTLLEKMQGRLELISAPAIAAQPTHPEITRLQCTLPWVMPEAEHA